MYHCTTDLFILFGFSCFAHVDLAAVLLHWSIQTSQTGGQPYSNTRMVSCSLLIHLKLGRRIIYYTLKAAGKNKTERLNVIWLIQAHKCWKLYLVICWNFLLQALLRHRKGDKSDGIVHASVNERQIFKRVEQNPTAEKAANGRRLKGKHHCIDGLQFGIDQIFFLFACTTFPNPSKWRSAAQWYFPYCEYSLTTVSDNKWTFYLIGPIKNDKLDVLRLGVERVTNQVGVADAAAELKQKIFEFKIIYFTRCKEPERVYGKEIIQLAFKFYFPL